MKARILYSLEVDDDTRKMIVRFLEDSDRKMVRSATQAEVREFFENHGKTSGAELLAETYERIRARRPEVFGEPSNAGADDAGADDAGADASGPGEDSESESEIV